MLNVSLLVAHVIQLQTTQFLFLLAFRAAVALSARRMQVGGGVADYFMRGLMDDPQNVKDALTAHKLGGLRSAPRERRERAMLPPRELAAARLALGRRVGVACRQVEAQPQTGPALERQLNPGRVGVRVRRGQYKK